MSLLLLLLQLLLFSALWRYGGSCTIFNGQLNSKGLRGSYSADGACPDAVYLDRAGPLQVLQARD